MLCAVAALLLPAFRRAPDSDIILCANFMRTNINTLKYYSQDWDEKYPNWSSDSNLDSKLRSYQNTQTYSFVCPATQQHFLYSAAIQGLYSTSVADNSTLEILRDPSPHPDGLITIGYADGQVLHGGVFAGDSVHQCIENARELAINLNLYSVDYDTFLPPVLSQATLQGFALPYTRASRVVSCPLTGNVYLPNTVLGGTNIYAFTDRNAEWLIKDATIHPEDGITTTAFLDGHVFRPSRSEYPLDGDTTNQCKEMQRVITRSVLLYASDYDDVLPVLTNSDETFPILSPYFLNFIVRRFPAPYIFEWSFTCPQTGLGYLFDAHLSGRPLSSFANLDSYWVVTDAIAHPDGQKTTSYLSGAVQHAGYINHVTNAQRCIASIKYDLRRTSVYMQDYDEVLPPMQNAAVYGRAISPYSLLKNELICPELNIPYTPNAALSGFSGAAISDWQTALILQDALRHYDGRYNLGYLDGHVGKKYLPQGGTGGIRRNVPRAAQPAGGSASSVH